MEVTQEMMTVLAIIVVAIVLFITGKIRVDVVALLVLVSLTATGLVSAADALAGFGNPAVVTIWAVFIISAGLSKTGVANIVGRQVLWLAGEGEVKLILAIMVTGGAMSAFMNNVGVAALMLPVVMDIARRTNLPPSKLLMPLSFGTLLGGLTTVIGTAPNILISDALKENGLTPFQLFDYAPVGLSVMVGGVVFMILVGRHLLPRSGMIGSSDSNYRDFREFYNLGEQLFVVHVPEDSVLVGKTLSESRLGSALDLNVIGIFNGGRRKLAPPPETVLQADDRLLVEGQVDRLSELRAKRYLVSVDEKLAIEKLVSSEIQVAEVTLSPHSLSLGKTLHQIDFRRRFGVNVLAIMRNGVSKRTHLADIPLQTGDILLVQGNHVQLDELRKDQDFLVSTAEQTEVYHMEERLMVLCVPEDSILVGKTLDESRLGSVFGLTVLGIIREGGTRLMPDPSERFAPGDKLLVEGKHEDLLVLQDLQKLEIEQRNVPRLKELESDRVGLAEVVLSPRTTLVGKSLRDIRFREKYGLNVIAIFSQGQAYRTNFRDKPLQFGDALLVYGTRDRLEMLGSESDFLVLSQGIQEALRLKKAPLATLVMGCVLLMVILNWLPISIASVAGAALMVITGCLTMDEAYRAIEWRAVFLIAGMMPLSVAMQQSGAAGLVIEGMVSALHGLGPTAIIAGMYVVTALAAQVIPTPAVAILIAPIAIDTARDMNLSPYALSMAVAMAASASFMSPFGHPANALIMGPGGYRLSDYIKVGLPLIAVSLAAVLIALPVFWNLDLQP